MDWLVVVLVGVLSVAHASRLIAFVRRTPKPQWWRRLDWFHLIPYGGFFAPGAPASEPLLMLRDSFSNGITSAWTIVPQPPKGHWVQALWNPSKMEQKARVECANWLLSEATAFSKGGGVPASFLLSEPYILLLQYAVELPRLASPSAVQFAVVEIDLPSKQAVRAFVGPFHEYCHLGRCN